MDTVARNKSFMQPKPMAELLSELGGIVSHKDAMQTLTAKKQPRSTMALTRTAVKSMKPLTIAEMRAEILALKAPSPRRYAQPTTSAKKKTWNSSVKLENKTKSRTSQGQLKHNPVRKGLTFLPKPMAPVTPETPKFPKPDLRAKKALHLQAKSSVRISGVCNIPETPVVCSIPAKTRVTLANKENVARQANINLKPQVTPVPKQKRIVPPALDTPLANMSWKSGSDTSFLLREKEVQDIDEKTLSKEHILENIDEVSPPVSTPFKDHRSVQEFFNHTEDIDNSALYNDNTIMSFDNVLKCKENDNEEDTVIVNLCDLLNKASVANVEHKSEQDDLLEVEKQLEHNINMVEKGIKTLTTIKESQLKSLHYVKKLIKEKGTYKLDKNENNTTLIKAKSTLEVVINNRNLNEISPISSKLSSVTKTKSVSYKIPKRSPCLRKTILYKSMPNVSGTLRTPNKDMGKRAFNMYMEMKTNEQMNFLNTPCLKRERTEVPDTPAMTSRNLQMQLDKIYKDNT